MKTDADIRLLFIKHGTGKLKPKEQKQLSELLKDPLQARQFERLLTEWMESLSASPAKAS